MTTWANVGVFEQLHLQVLDRLGGQGRLDWSQASVDAMSVRAKRGGPCRRKSGRPWQAWKQAPPGLRRRRVPLTSVVTAANVSDTSMFQAVVEDIPPVRTPAGRRRTRQPPCMLTRHPTRLGVKPRPAVLAVEAGRTRCSPGRAAGFVGNGAGSRAAG
jgi:hypothetical protein